MSHLIFFSLLAAAAAAFAVLEVHIEGGSGWARSLPTWRFSNRWTRALIGAREITGYHVWVHLFVFLIAHLPYAIAPELLGWGVELRILAFLVFFWILEDFLWFVFNPAFGVRRFTPRHAWWHADSWWAFMPRDYWIFLPLGLLLYLAGRGL